MNNEELNENIDSDKNDETLQDNSSDDYGSEKDNDAESEEQDGSDGDSNEEIEQLRREKADLEKKLKEKSIKARIAKKKSEDDENENSISPEKVTKALLAAKGVTEKDEIEFVTGLAKKIGQDPDDAVDDDYVKFKLESFRKNKTVSNAVPGSSKKGTSTQKGVDWYIANNKMPDDAKTASEVRDELAKRARNGA